MHDPAARRRYGQVDSGADRLTLRAERPRRHDAAVTGRQPVRDAVPHRAGDVGAVDEHQGRPGTDVDALDRSLVDDDPGSGTGHVPTLSRARSRGESHRQLAHRVHLARVLEPLRLPGEFEIGQPFENLASITWNIILA